MSRLLKSICLILFFLFLCTTFVFAEEITITTYYPSPYGSYNEIKLQPHTPPVAACDNANPSNEGSLYFDSLAHELKICVWDGANYAWASLSAGPP